MPAAPLKTFIIYASQDRDLRIELERHLKLLELEGSIKLWSDKEILPGEHWDDAIKRQLAVADLFLMLVSVDFFNSDYIQRKEFKTALRRLESGDSLAIPIIVRPCLWKKNTVINSMQVLPPEGRAVTDWPAHDSAWTIVAEQISERVEQLIVERAEAKRQRQEEKERLAGEAEQARLAEQEKQRQAEAATRAERERSEREQEEAKRRQQEEKERLAKEAQQARLAEQARLAREAEQVRLVEQEKQRQVEAAAQAERERLARERAEREAREEEARREAERKRQEEERAALFKKAHDDAWQNAEEQHTAEAYRDFLKTYPVSPHAAEAKKRIKELEPESSRKYVWLFGGGLGVVLLLWFIINLLTGSLEETRAPGCYLAKTVLDGALATEADLEFVLEKDKSYSGITTFRILGRCFRSPDSSREIPKGTRITEEYLGRCAGIYAAQNLREGTPIERKILDIEPSRPGSEKRDLYDFNSQLLDKGFCVKCGTTLQKGQQLTFNNIERCGGVYLTKDLAPGTKLTRDMVEDVPPSGCAKEQDNIPTDTVHVVGMPLSSNKSQTFPAGKQLNYKLDF